MMKPVRIALLAALCLALICAVACENTEEGELIIANNGESRFIIVRSDFSDDTVTDAAVLLKRAMSAVTGAEIRLATDWEKTPDESEIAARYEILVGTTNRPESAAAAEGLGADDYVIRIIGNKLVIAAGSDRSLVTAVDEFVTDVLKYTSETDHAEKPLLILSSDYIKHGGYVMKITAQTPDNRPCIVKTEYPTDDVVVADIIATDRIYGADPTGVSDSTAAIQQALNACHAAGGGTVFLPAGRYLVTSSITVPTFVTLRGDYGDPDSDADGYGTVIMAKVESVDANFPALFYLSASGGVMGLTVFYPDQTLDNVLPYPFTFYVGTEGFMLQTIMDCTVINGYRGIGACVIEGQGHEQMTIDNVKGTFLYRAAVAYNQSDVGTWKNLTIKPDYWAEAGAEYNAPDAEQLRAYTRENCVALTLGDLEWTEFANTYISDCKTAFHIVDGFRIQFAGSIYGLQVENCDTGILADNMDARWGMVVANSDISVSGDAFINNSDGVMKLAGVKYKGGVSGNGQIIRDDTSLSAISVDYGISPVKPPAQLYVFTPEDPATDIGPALQLFADSVLRAGGGIVYIPAGTYRIDTPISFGTGVELRGAGSLPLRDQMGDSRGTVLISYFGDDIENTDYGTALITLGENGGARNIRIVYPENVEMHPYTYAIRGTGNNVYVINCGIVNAWNGVDLNGCNYSVVKKLVCYCENVGIRVANCKGGSIEGCLQNGTVVIRHGLPFNFNLPTLNVTSRDNSTLIYLYNVSDQQVFNCFAYGVRTLVECTASSDVRLLNIGSDNIGGNQLVFNASECTVVNSLRWNGLSVSSDEASELAVYNRLTINKKDEPTINKPATK